MASADVTQSSATAGAAPGTREQAEAFKAQGNKYFAENKFDAALEEYSKAIEIDSTNAVYLSNRAFCHLKLESFGSALEDATKAIQADPKYIKALYRRGAAYMSLCKFGLAVKDFKQVTRISADADAKRKLAAAEAALAEYNFMKAIECEDEPLPSATIKWETVPLQLPADYAGPKWADDQPMSQQFVSELIPWFLKQKQLPKRYVYRIVLEIIALLKKLPSLMDIAVPEGSHINVCGDVHGQFYDVVNIFSLAGAPSESNPFLFNGDFVDRGSFSFEVIMLFFALKLTYPNHFHLHRGNHETINMNNIYGFKGELTAKCDARSFDLFTEAFNWLPLGSVLGKKVLVVHGGIFSEDGVKLEQMRKIDRFRQPPEEGLMCEMLWSDPQVATGRAPSKRGVGFAFGPDVTSRFLQDNGLSMIVRSHEVKADGYEIMHDGQCWTVFSAPNYCDQMGNKGAYIRFESDMKPQPVSFSAVPHPEVKPMAFASPFMRFG